jgi:multicomponent Na+:H+ antiporter subunit E
VRRSLLVAWLLVVWLALWQDVSFANVVSGLVAAIALVVLFPIGQGHPGVRVRPLATAWFAAFFAWKLVEANAIVAWQVLRPGSSVVEGIVAVPLTTPSWGIATIVANAVTLTPGTLTMDTSQEGPEGPITLYVHVLQLGDPADIRADVWEFERLATRAFGGRPAARP